MADEPQAVPPIAHVAFGSVGAATAGILVAILKARWGVDFSGQETNLAVVIGFGISVLSIRFSS
jgi:hypothetical protein